MQRKGSVTRLATPIKALAQRFAFLLLVALSFALMMIMVACGGRPSAGGGTRARFSSSRAPRP